MQITLSATIVVHAVYCTVQEKRRHYFQVHINSLYYAQITYLRRYIPWCYSSVPEDQQLVGPKQELMTEDLTVQG